MRRSEQHTIGQSVFCGEFRTSCLPEGVIFMRFQHMFRPQSGSISCGFSNIIYTNIRGSSLASAAIQRNRLSINCLQSLAGDSIRIYPQPLRSSTAILLVQVKPRQAEVRLYTRRHAWQTRVHNLVDNSNTVQ